MQNFGKNYVLEERVVCEGVGLHNGKKVAMEIGPKSDNSGGIRFIREKGLPIDLHHESVKVSALCTLLQGKDGTEVRTVEHLLAAMFMLGIASAEVRLDACEVPIMDGSAGPFLTLLDNASKREEGEVEWISPQGAFEVKAGVFRDGFVKYEPHADGTTKSMEITFEIDYKNRVIGNQKERVVIKQAGDDIVEVLGQARTFCLLSDLQKIRMLGLGKGGSLDNAVVVGADGVMNEGGFRVVNECVKHKLMDSLGDMWTCGKYVNGRLYFYKSGHALNNKFVRALMQRI